MEEFVFYVFPLLCFVQANIDLNVFVFGFKDRFSVSHLDLEA